MSFTLDVSVVPKSSRAAVVPDGEGRYKVYVHAAPDRGRANAAVIALLAAHFGVAKSRVTIRQGAAGRHKRIAIDTEPA
jgi:uncharacterized protein (TIGR00251 family)